jgi:hypothetical protein
VLRPAKLFVNLLLNALATAATLGLIERTRKKLATYATLAHWHLRLCPEGWGLPRDAGPEAGPAQALSPPEPAPAPTPMPGSST